MTCGPDHTSLSKLVPCVKEPMTFIKERLCLAHAGCSLGGRMAGRQPNMLTLRGAQGSQQTGRPEEAHTNPPAPHPVLCSCLAPSFPVP